MADSQSRKPVGMAQVKDRVQRNRVSFKLSSRFLASLAKIARKKWNPVFWVLTGEVVKGFNQLQEAHPIPWGPEVEQRDSVLLGQRDVSRMIVPVKKLIPD